MSILTQTSKSYSGFTPLSIPGCSLWLDAADSSSLTLSGSSVTQWKDKSGGSSLTQSTPTNQPTLGTNSNLPMLRFNNSWLSTLSSPFNWLNSTLFIVFQQVATYSGQIPRVFSGIPSSAYSDDYLGKNGLNVSAGYASNVFICTSYNYATSAYVSNSVSGTPPSPLAIYSFTLNNNVGTIFSNGTQSGNAQSGYSMDGSNGRGFIVGHGWTSGGINTIGNAYPIDGWVAEVILFNSVLTTVQRQQIEGYLAWKWRIIPITTFYPTSIPGCQLWIDAADSSTVTITNGSISGVSDKSGNGYNLTGGIAFTYNTTLFQNKYPSFFNTSTAADGKIGSNASFNLNQPMTVFATGVMSVGNNDMIFDGNTKRIALYNSTANLFAGPGDQIFTATNYLLSPYVICGVANTTNSAVFVNGTNVVSGTIGTDPLTSIVVGNRTGGSGSPYRGHLCEFIIFNSALTTAQRQQVEGYLARKWGIYSTIPNTHPYKLTPLYTQPFSPIDIPGCALWLDAADNTTLSLSGSTLAGWVDKSGTGKAITINSAPSYSATGFNSKYPCFTFTTSNYLTTTIPAIGTGDVMFVLVGKYTNPGQNSVPLSAGPAASGGELGLGWNLISNLYNFYQYGVAGYGGSDNTIGGNINVIHIGSRISSTMAVFINGALPPITGTNSTNNAYTTFYIGNTGSFSFAGQICEVLLYIGTTTTTQRQQLEGYLAKKWGLQGSLVSAHPFKLYPPLTPVFNPLQISGCQLWLDAADSSTLTLSGSSVTQWRDKSGNGYTASPTTATKTSSNSVLIGSNGLTFANYSWRTRYTAFFVSKGGVYAIVTYRPAQNYLIYVYTPNWSLSVIYPPTGGAIEMNDSAIAQGTSVVDVNAMSLFTIGYADGSTFASPYAINGTARSTTRTAGAYANDGYFVGNLVFNNLTSTELFEVIFYNDNLTTAQYQQVEGYLAQKWRLRVLPSTHPYKMFSTPFAPSQIAGLSLWLDASDSTSLTLSGSSVTQWRDKSGNGYSATAAAGSGPTRTSTINGLTCLSSSNNKYLTISNFNQNFSQASVFWVIKPTEDITPNNKTADGYPQYIVINGSTLGYIQSGIVYSNPTQTSTTDYFQSCLNKAGTGLLYGNLGGSSRSSYNPLNQVLLESFILNGLASTNEVYNNGTSLTKVSVDGTFPSLSGITINIAGSPNRAYGYSFGYDVAEILIFNSPLTTSQRQQVEGYLAWKWGLTSSLPSGHPYKNAKP